MASRDTSEPARRAQLDAQKALGGGGRIELAFRMSDQARRISIAGMQSRNPTLSEAEARARVIRRLLGDALYEVAYERSTS